MSGAVDEHDIWVLQETYGQLVRLSGPADDSDTGELVYFLENEHELEDADYELQTQFAFTHDGDTPFPPGFPIPQLSVAHDVAFDYFSVGSYEFVSRRLREALAQPPDVLQYWPIKLVEGSAEACGQDYMLMRVLRWHAALDLERSKYQITEDVRAGTGEKRLYYDVEHFVARRDLPTWPEIFRVSEHLGWIMVTDALAQRVSSMSCGVEFFDPESLSQRRTLPTTRMRTAAGIAFQDHDGNIVSY